MIARDAILTALARNGDFLFGAAVGAGLPAKAAERGGADFILLLNAGRLRMRGTSSLACYLPLENGNRWVEEIGRGEVLSQVELPVFMGVSAADPRQPVSALVDRAAAAGFAGLVNFPLASVIDGRLRALIEANGIGFKRECALIRRTREAGLVALGYVGNNEEAHRMADAGADLICANLGFTAGGTGVPTELSLDQAAELAGTVLHGLPRSVMTLVEGGPIVSPDEAYEVCRKSGVGGYIGGSTLDRLPMEATIESVTRTYKTIARLQADADSMRADLLGQGHTYGLIGQSPVMSEVARSIRKAAPTDLPVLLTGENGTGKELAAAAIHRHSPRAGKTMVAVNCAAIPETLIESELFGHERGAFTGATRTRAGRFVEANGGTLFLDEVGELPPAIQAKLLRVLESGEVQAVGSDRVQTVDVRIISATNRDIEAMVAQGLFREDLYFRMNTIQLHLPPLRERLGDLPALVRHFLRGLSDTPGLSEIDLDTSGYRALFEHNWPGNVRELRNAIQRAAAMAEGPKITRQDLAFLAERQQAGPRTEEPAPVPATGEPAAPAVLSERDWILAALRRNRFRRAETARELGISTRTLYNKSKKYRLFE